jgi:hypothetical protein
MSNSMSRGGNAMRKLNKLFLISLLFIAVGCAPAINDVKMGRSIFLHSDRTEKVYVDVRNTSSYQNFPLEQDIKAQLRAKGYKVVNRARNAKYRLRVINRYCGLAADAFTGKGTAIGAGTGAAAGALTVYAASGDDQGTAAGAAIGAGVCAIIGSIIENQARKTTFVGVVDIEITERGEPFPHLTTVTTTVRQRKLTAQQALDMVRSNIVSQIAGIF